MSEQALDLRRSAQIVWRRKIAVGVFAALGIAAGIGVTLYRPPLPASEALVDVVLPPSEQGAAVSNGLTTVNPVLATQIVIAESNPVLRNTLRAAHLPVSLQTLQSRVQVTSLASSDVLAIRAEGKTAAQAESTANAVARNYLAYSRKSQSAQAQARVLEQAKTATAPSLFYRLLLTGGLGALAGAVVGAVGALAFHRKDRRLRRRDEIADSIGVPVLASIRVVHPSGAAGWARLLTDYEPAAVDAWRLRQALQQLGLADPSLNGSRPRGDSAVLEVISFDFDSRALALGPQLARFAASRRIPAALVAGPLRDVTAAATLRAACAAWAAPLSGTSPLQVIVKDHDDGTWPSDVALTVVVTVVDGQHPQVADTTRTAATVLGVSAGAATAEQLARVAAAAAAAGRDITGFLVADPDRDDPTTGRRPQLVRPAHRRQPTRMTGTAVETWR